MGARGWIDGDESGREMLSRLLTNCPYIYLPPPFHKLPLRIGNVVELVGPSPSAKTHILMHSAINCILPKYWNGVHFGGFGHFVSFIDLDCRFDILRLSQLLKNRIIQATRSTNSNPEKQSNVAYDEELFVACMKRFCYIRCYDSLEFLATLKTLHYQLRKEKEAQGISVNFMMIDRKNISLQNVSATVVQEIKDLMMVHPMIVIVTKATIRGNRYAANKVEWNLKRPCSPDSAASIATNSMQQLLHHEYMPSVWQSFVTLRLLVHPADDISIDKKCNKCVYLSEWLLPPLGFVDNFTVDDDAGILCTSSHDVFLYRH